jgi:hypothetical protein
LKAQQYWLKEEVRSVMQNYAADYSADTALQGRLAVSDWQASGIEFSRKATIELGWN